MPRKRVSYSADESSGIECPNCGSRRHRVKYTRWREDASIFRLRVCDHCGREIRTREAVI